MRKVIVYIAMSLDGYVADKSGSVSWLNGDGSDPENMGSYPVFIETVDTVILGYTTYHQIVTELSPDVWPYESKKSCVLTHRPHENTENITFVDENLVDLITRLKAQDGKDIWICGGASIVNQAIKHNLVDEFCVTLIPTIIGGGISLFSTQETEQKLKLVSTKQYNGMVDLVYHRR